MLPVVFMPVSYFGIAKASSAGDPQERVGVLRGGPTGGDMGYTKVLADLL